MKVLSTYMYNRQVGGVKAKSDIEKILKEEFGAKIISVKDRSPKHFNSIYQIYLKFIRILAIVLNMFTKELIIVQVPFTNPKLLKLLKNKVALIHDIHGLQTKDEERLKEELDFYKTCNRVIAHNEKMKQYLVENGIDKDKIVVLELFDYLTDCDAINSQIQTEPIIVYSGMLNEKKAPFIYDLDADKMEFSMNLYGIEYKSDFSNKKINYCGSYSPVELPKAIEGNLGLVWDGKIDDSDEDEGFKSYTKLNNPHKISCYIATGLPVVVWEKSAMADFVNKYDIGYTINHIYDINKIDFSTYDEKKNNVEKIRTKVITGVFTKSVIKKVNDNEE